MGKYVLVLLVTLAAATPQQRQAASLAAREWQWRELALPRIETQRAVTQVDAEARWYVTALGTRLADGVPAPRVFQYRFVLYDDSTGLDLPWFGRLEKKPRVYALPGGVVVVPVSLFDAAADESEFAAAVARAVAHVELWHFERMAGLMGQQGPTVKPIPPADPRLQRPVEPMPFSRSLIFTRALEGEADAGAVGVLAASGIDPQALLRHAGNRRASLDVSAARLRRIEEAIGKLPPRTYGASDSPRFETLKTRLGGVRVTL
jgi:hypothetical protein